jgi:hypothetical protein
MKDLDDPNELNKYLTGKKGKAFHFNLDMDAGPEFSQDDIEDLQKMYGEMTAEDEQEMEEQYGKDWFKPEETVEK